MKTRILFLVWIAPFIGLGAVVVDKVPAKGTGLSQQEAVFDALSHAVRMVRGVEVDTKRSLKSLFYSRQKGEEVKLSWKRLQKVDISTQTKGYVQSFEIVNGPHKLADDAGWEVEVLASVPRYKTVGQKQDHLKRIAIMPFRAVKPAFQVGAVQLPAAQVSTLMSQKLNEYLIQARKFRVLDRDYFLEVDKEKGLLKKGAAPLEDLVRLEQRLGTDYLVVGTLRQLNLTQQVIPNAFNLPPVVRNSASVIAEFRVIEVANQQAVWADTKNMIFDNRALAARLPARADAEQVQQALIGLAADEIVNEILDVIYPVKVMDTEGQVVLNQGGKRVRVGSHYQIEGPGKKVIDPDTGLTIKIGGAKRTLIVITEVKPKYSIGKIIDGEKDIKVGQVCRRVQVQLAPAPAPQKKPAPEGSRP